MIPIVSLAAGIAMTRASAQELFDQQEGTPTQILTIALPILAHLAIRAAGSLKGRKIEWNPSVVAPYIMGALLAIVAMTLEGRHPASFCSYYETCPNIQPHFVPECRRLQEECQSTLKKAFWSIPDRFIAHSARIEIGYHGGDMCPSIRLVQWCVEGVNHEVAYEEKNDAVAQLCARIAEPTLHFYRKRDDACIRPKDEELQKVVHIQQELAHITHCHPDIENNPYYRVISQVNLLMIGAITVIVWIYIVEPRELLKHFLDRELHEIK
jgi:hypothetical protein